MAFATRCASCLYQGVRVIIVDIVTNHRANLHNEVLRVMKAGDSMRMPRESSLYPVAYQPLRRGKSNEIEVWRSPVAVGQAYHYPAQQRQ